LIGRRRVVRKVMLSLIRGADQATGGATFRLRDEWASLASAFVEGGVLARLLGRFGDSVYAAQARRRMKQLR
jgi:hypothetical protein